MAEAEKHEEVRVVEEFVTLKLTMAEARAVYAVTTRVGGSPGTGSPRGLIDNVRDAIRDVCRTPYTGQWDNNWSRPEVELFDDDNGHQGVSFNDYPKGDS